MPKLVSSSMWNMIYQQLISGFEPKLIVAIAVITSQLVWHTLIQNNYGWGFKQFCHLCSKSRGGGHIPENLKIRAFLLTHGLELNSGMTKVFCTSLIMLWEKKKKSDIKKDSKAFKAYN